MYNIILVLEELNKFINVMFCCCVMSSVIYNSFTLIAHAQNACFHLCINFCAQDFKKWVLIVSEKSNLIRIILKVFTNLQNIYSTADIF